MFAEIVLYTQDSTKQDHRLSIHLYPDSISVNVRFIVFIYH